ncbi:hypothetical protein [Haladaptatus cibarius]|uniref:hypothetical protein n=1 Tax=Haladaptatus cibarius TaxID=453847 RepID=UPI0006785B0D|nr:hypothetical protein [Haladaptatus cibarius]
MGKMGLALKLSDKLGTSVQKSLRYIDDVGNKTARKSLDEAASKGDDALQIGWKPIAGVGAVGGGGLIWRQQAVEKAKAIAEQEQAASDSLASIVDSDLPPSLKQELAKQYVRKSSESKAKSGGLPFENIQQTVVALVVLALVLKYVLGAE